MRISEIQPDQLTRTEITRFLFQGVQDDGQPGDCIFVFGSRSRQRVVKAVKLYKAGRAPFILLSGGTRWGEIVPAEAFQMKEQALQLGVPESAILTECESNHTGENVIASLLVLDRALGLNKIKRILVVSSPSHIRRCWLTLRTYMPPWIEYSLCPDDRKYGQAHNWWESPDEEQRVLKEARSLVKYVREGHLLDLDTEIFLK